MVVFLIVQILINLGVTGKLDIIAVSNSLICENVTMISSLSRLSQYMILGVRVKRGYDCVVGGRAERVMRG